MRMLSNEDLQAIGTIVDEKIQSNNGRLGDVIDERIEKKLEPVLEAVREGFGAVDRRLEAVDQRFEQMASKEDLHALRHELMDHTDQTVHKAVGDLRSELRERKVIA